MIYKLIVFFIFFSFYHAKANENNQLIFHDTPKKIENLTLTKLNDSKVKISQFSNKFLIVNFWATWCPPCVKEIPDLIELEKKLNNKIKVIFISLDSNPKDSVKKFIKKNKFKNFEVYTDNNFSISKKLNVKVMPTTVIIDKNLREVSRLSGYADWLDDEIFKKIEDL